jgi:hypothetical protein
MLRIALLMLLLTGCSTTSTLHLCQNHLEPINPPLQSTAAVAP